MTEEELVKMTVKQLREFAAANTKLTGTSAMKKETLLNAVMNEIGIEKAKKAPKLDLSDKKSTKNEIRRLKHKKHEVSAGETVNFLQLKNIRRRLRKLKKHMRRSPLPRKAPL